MTLHLDGSVVFEYTSTAIPCHLAVKHEQVDKFEC